MRVIEKERQDRIDELVVKRKDKEERIEQQRLEREKERLKVASEKARFIFSIQHAVYLYIFFPLPLHFWLLYFFNYYIAKYFYSLKNRFTTVRIQTTQILTIQNYDNLDYAFLNSDNSNYYISN